MKKHLKLKITGKVQGVWYRASLKRKAQDLGILGFVQNQKDGSVYAEVEAAEDHLNELVKWCWKGPELANVQSVTVEEGNVLDFNFFEIR